MLFKCLGQGLTEIRVEQGQLPWQMILSPDLFQQFHRNWTLWFRDDTDLTSIQSVFRSARQIRESLNQVRKKDRQSDQAGKLGQADGAENAIGDRVNPPFGRKRGAITGKRWRKRR